MITLKKVVEAISVIKGNADQMLEEINMHSELFKV